MTAIKKLPSFSIFLMLACAAVSIALLSVPSSSSTSPLLPPPSSKIPTWFLASISLGEWNLLHSSIGISAMHMQLLHDNTVIAFDRTDFGRSNLSLPHNQCRYDPNDLVLKHDCTAHSVLYDVASNSIRPLKLSSDTWCSSGAVDFNGTLIQTGGFNDGDRVVRTFFPCGKVRRSCDWEEEESILATRRWYASNQVLPDGRIIVVGGRNAFSYEFLPKKPPHEKAYFLPFLRQTWDFLEENNLYPFLHLLPDGTLFIFANTRSIAFDYNRGTVVKSFPKIPGGDKRNYPSTGSSVLLPIYSTHSPDAEVMICGGAPKGSFLKATRGIYVAASGTCGRLKVTDQNPCWKMEAMPIPRVLSDMVLLPTGDVIIINGAQNGTAGWDNAANPAQYPVLYVPSEPNPAQRFVTLNPSPIPRLYHSTAALLADGRILIGGSNPHPFYNFTARPYPTDLSLEAFSPYYLAPEYGRLRPTIVSAMDVVSYRRLFAVSFSVVVMTGESGVYATAVAPAFVTHSFGMNQRVVVVEKVRVDWIGMFEHRLILRAPMKPEIAPPGYYMLFVVHAGIPSQGVWIKLQA